MEKSTHRARLRKWQRIIAGHSIKRGGQESFYNYVIFEPIGQSRWGETIKENE